jgi:hypothetical protein
MRTTEQRGTDSALRDVKLANDPFCTAANPTFTIVLQYWAVPPARATVRECSASQKHDLSLHITHY